MRFHNCHNYVEGMVRVWRRVTERLYKVVLELRHPAMPWLVRHSAWTHDRFLPHQSDGLTSFERQFEKQYSKPVVPLLETVVWKEQGANASKYASPWGYGIYLGRSYEDDTHILGTRHGIVQARTIKRLIEEDRYDKELLLAMKGIPSDTKAANATPPLPEDLSQPRLEPAAPPPPPAAPSAAAAPSEPDPKPPRVEGGGTAENDKGDDIEEGPPRRLRRGQWGARQRAAPA